MIEQKVYNIQEIATLLATSTDKVQKLTTAGVLSYAMYSDGSILKGRYFLHDTIPKYCKYFANKLRSKNPSIAYDDARTLRMQEMARTAAIKNGLLTGQVYLASDVENVTTTMLLGVRSRLLTLPSQVARLLIGLEDFDRIMTILTDAMHDALEGLQTPSDSKIRGETKKIAEFMDVFADSNEKVEVK